MTVSIISASGCATQAVPAPDLDTTFADLTKQMEDMAETLKAIPDQFELDTPKKVKAANQLLEDTANRLESQATTFRDTQYAIRNYRNVTGPFDGANVDAYIQALERFDGQWNRIEKNNPQATQRLAPLWQIVQDAT